MLAGAATAPRVPSEVHYSAAVLRATARILAPVPAIVEKKTFTFHQSLPRDEPALFFSRANGTPPAKPAGRLREDTPFGRSRGFGLRR